MKWTRSITDAFMLQHLTTVHYSIQSIILDINGLNWMLLHLIPEWFVCLVNCIKCNMQNNSFEFHRSHKMWLLSITKFSLMLLLIYLHNHLSLNLVDSYGKCFSSVILQISTCRLYHFANNFFFFFIMFNACLTYFCWHI